MNALKIYCVALLFAACEVGASGLVDPASPTNSGPKGAVLVFSDEFNGPTLSKEKWNVGINQENTLHGRLDCSYSERNISFQDGKMVFTARHHPDGVRGRLPEESRIYKYSSGAINSANKFYVRQNMYVEARVKLPTNKGGYCIFSAMPNSAANAGFKDPTERMEIRFFEYVASEDRRIFASLLWFNDYLRSEIPSDLSESDYFRIADDHYVITALDRKARWTGSTSPLPVLDWYEWYEWNDFVTVGFVATPRQLDWFIVEDGPVLNSPPYMSFSGATVHSPAHKSRVNREDGKEDVWRRDVPGDLENSLVLDFSLREADWAGGPILKEELPSRMVIDYIRVYQLSETE
ncbi:glycoside hydrolase family 16 protein [Pontiella sulfatireligans]|uniref:Glucan endo-1,3-beta-glucosidase A1 n=1 Tax=Pontiella sulfatireligans TaxID=2750658 RepID=A0A6C2UNE4_9BACT|nr:hypothetical protein [Pontiella sulfatireligans]VGO20801.1 Glucan endo-1,3-beta-glucosidase A1 [Pontiella sulfatireligans]